MLEQTNKSRIPSHMTAKEKAETAATLGTTILGLIGVMTLPFSLIAVVLALVGMVCAVFYVAHHYF